MFKQFGFYFYIEFNKMKINPNYKLRNIAGESIIVKQGTKDLDLTHIISLNQSAKFLYETFIGKEFTEEEVAQVLETTFGISQERAKNDARIWIESMKECHVIK